MNTGSDYLLARALRSRRTRRLVGVALVTVGALLLAASGAYYLYARVAQSQLDDLEVTVPSTPPPDERGGETVDLPGLTVAQEVPTVEITTPEPTTAPAASPTPTAPPLFIIPASRFSTLYPGQGIHPKFWDAPEWAEEPIERDKDLIQGFQTVNWRDLPAEQTISPATRILVPAIDLDSPVKELAVVDLGDSRSWETPKNVVGHIPTTPNAGELGRGYFFGHLESPIRGEGNVFSRLPEIPQLLREGEDVYVILSNDQGTSYLYRIIRTEVVAGSELRLEEASMPHITLVTCVPRLVYSHRLVVTAELVGVKTS